MSEVEESFETEIRRKVVRTSYKIEEVSNLFSSNTDTHTHTRTGIHKHTNTHEQEEFSSNFPIIFMPFQIQHDII